jgi:hypothetical protein
VRRHTLALCLFWLGVFLLFVHTTMPALWQLAGLSAPYPLASNEGLLGLSAGFTPPLGAAMIFAAGFLGGPASENGSGR